MGMKVLVVGGTGMLGEPVARRLAAAGYGVRVLTRSPERAGRLSPACELVSGDVDDGLSLARAIDGCQAVHISLNGRGDWDLERRGARAIASLAVRLGVQRISLLSGASTSAENAWFPMTAAKLDAEEAVRESGVPFSIFRCTMFMETLPRFVHDGRAMVMGRQPYPWHWLAADDYAAMVARAIDLPGAENKLFHVRGPQALTLEEALQVYRRFCWPQMPVLHEPFWILRLLAHLPGGEGLRREGLPLMLYFAKVPEAGDPTETSALLGAPSTTLATWCLKRAALQPSRLAAVAS